MTGRITITTNNVPRDLIQAHELTEAERSEFDYLDWANIDEGSDSATFFRYQGELYDLGELSTDWGITHGTGIPAHLAGWDAYVTDTFFSGIVVRYPKMYPEYPDKKDIDYERVIVGRFYVS